MTTTTDTCWADPLSSKERAEVARLLARACGRFWRMAEPRLLYDQSPATAASLAFGEELCDASLEMSDLHLDVTERAEVPPDVLERARKRFAELSEMAEDPDWLGI